MKATQEMVEKKLNLISALTYKDTFYVVDYFNYPNESESGEIEFICVDQENEYLSDKAFETERITFSMLLEDENSKLYTVQQIF